MIKEIGNMKEKFYVKTALYFPSGIFHIVTSFTEGLAITLKKYNEKR